MNFANDCVIPAFERLKLKPRPGQIEVCVKILDAFVNKEKKNVILSAPTGSGKSIIGMVIAECITHMINFEGVVNSSIMLTATNLLADQYSTTFDEIADRLKDTKEEPIEFLTLKGANNYECTANDEQDSVVPVTAENCSFYDMTRAKQCEFDDIINNHCKTCVYRTTKARKNMARHVTTNYAMYFVDRLYIKGPTGFSDRDLIVWDEAHLLNDIFSEHLSIYFSQKIANEIRDDFKKYIRLTDIRIGKNLKILIDAIAKKGAINETNFTEYLDLMSSVYLYARDAAKSEEADARSSGNKKMANAYNRLARKYEGRFCKIDDFNKFQWPRVFDAAETEASFSVKPIFVGRMFKELQASEFNLFLSATLSDTFLTTTLELDTEETEYIKMASVFPVENKKVIFFNPRSLNYQKMQEKQTIEKLVKDVSQIVQKHSKLGERGIVLAPSFAVVESLRDALGECDTEVFEHQRGQRGQDILREFKSWTGGPAVLVSPSMYEGVDLPGDLSRYQIIIKAPYPSLADKRIKYILDNYPAIYNIQTLMKIVQGAGRSVRSPEDYAVTYILDSNAQRLFFGKENSWRDEFAVFVEKGELK